MGGTTAMRQGIARPHNSGHWCACRRGLVAPRRTEREHAQPAGEGGTVVIITTLTSQLSTLWDISEDHLGSGAPRDDGNTFPPGAHRQFCYPLRRCHTPRGQTSKALKLIRFIYLLPVYLVFWFALAFA